MWTEISIYEIEERFDIGTFDLCLIELKPEVNLKKIILIERKQKEIRSPLSKLAYFGRILQ